MAEMGFDPSSMPTGNMTSRFTRESERRMRTEKKFGDELLAFWQTDALPDDAVVTLVTLIPYRGERPVLAWREGRLSLPEGEVGEGETAEAALRRVALEQAGLLDLSIRHLGHFRCKATVYSKTRAPGTITYHALYAAEVGAFADFPADETFQRRVIAQRDLNVVLRNGYVERRLEFIDALDAWLLERLRAAAQKD